MRDGRTPWIVLAGLVAACCPTPAPATPPPPPARSVELVETGPTPLERWRHAELRRPDAPTLDVYLAGSTEPKPLLILLQGSNCLPLFGERIRPDGGVNQVSSNIFGGLEDAAPPQFHLALLERDGVHSFGEPYAADAWPPPRITPECAERAYDKELRVRDAADLVLAVRAQPWVTRVVVAGHSEGGDIAAGVARLLGPELVDAVGLFAGAGGATQFFDSMALARNAGNNREPAQILDDLVWVADHRDDPGRHEGAEDYAIRRWVTFALDSDCLSDMLQVDMPVFVAHGTVDTNMPIQTADLFVAELLRHGRRRVHYEMLVDNDHSFACPDGESTLAQVFDRFLAWAASPPAAPEIGVYGECPPPPAAAEPSAEE